MINRQYYGSIWGPVGSVQVDLDLDDMNTPADLDDDEVSTVYYINPNHLRHHDRASGAS